jgi:hypothetical protein
MFDFLPITEYTVVVKKRGRKKKSTLTDLNKNITCGSIITLDLCNQVRGIISKKKKKKDEGSSNFFRNSMTIVMMIDGDNKYNDNVDDDGNNGDIRCHKFTQ